MHTIRINGLVRLANRVRQSLAEPLTAEMRDQLQHQVHEGLSTVERILARHHGTPAQLPPPSRKAYEFLAHIDFANLTIAEAPVDPGPATASVRFTGLRQTLEDFLERLATVSADDRDQSLASLRQVSARLERGIKRQNLKPHQLTPETRTIRGWLAFFADRDNLSTYLQGRDCAHGVFAQAACAGPRFHPDVRVRFRPMNGLFRWQNFGRYSRLSLPTPMINFDAPLFRHLAGLAVRRHRDRQPILEAMTDEGYQAVQAELEALGGVAEQTAGAAYDLGELFAQINRTYFRDTLPRPRLTWNRTFTHRKFGHYDPVQDTVMISASLDRSDVPSFVVEYVLYHELLHKVHGTDWRNGRAHVHTPAFRRDEERFPHYREAEAWLKKLAAV